jgi:hypothetical protein
MSLRLALTLESYKIGMHRSLTERLPAAGYSPKIRQSVAPPVSPASRAFCAVARSGGATASAAKRVSHAGCWQPYDADEGCMLQVTSYDSGME